MIKGEPKNNNPRYRMLGYGDAKRVIIDDDQYSVCGYDNETGGLIHSKWKRVGDGYPYAVGKRVGSFNRGWQVCVYHFRTRLKGTA